MKKLTCLLLILLMIQTSASARELQLPPLPEESLDAEEIAIVILNENEDTQSMKRKILQAGLEVRHTYKYAINGFSVKGKKGDIAKINEAAGISFISRVNTYTVQSDDNIKLIGGQAIRGYFDEENKRLTGKGVTVGIIDTGIDYNHPDLRRSYGGGRDLVDGDDDPMETKKGQSTLHGTHVAGIIAANGKIKGVAPEATVRAYRALGPGGSGTTEQVIGAIEEAIKDKVDVLNLSLGNNVNGPDLPISMALNKAVDHGVVAVTSSGNSGPNVWTVGSPGTAAKAISVGASTPTMNIPYLQGNDFQVRLNPIQGSLDWDLHQSYEIIDGGIARKEELKNASGKIVLAERGELTFTEKSKNAFEAGAVALVIYNNTKGNFMGNLEKEIPIPITAISKEDGELLLRQIEKRKIIARTYIMEEKDILADFSSRGPVTSTWEIKPDVVAPGVAINSTIPGGYLPLQGTSMAAPHVAGAAVLLKQAHSDWGPEKIKAALMNTAKPIANEEGVLYRAYEQGAGRIQLEEALNSPSLVMPASLQFGKFKLADRMHEHSTSIMVENTSKDRQTYSFAIPHQEKGIHWRLPISFNLKPGEKKKLKITMSADPAELKEKIYDGRLALQASFGDIEIPYLYVLEEPDYPRVMGFGFGKGDKKGTYRYEVYLPGGADEFGIALFDSDSLKFEGFLDWKRNLGKGQIQEVMQAEGLPEPGLYIAKVFARKAGKEDWLETYLVVGQNGELEEQLNRGRNKKAIIEK
ncbi:S8 family serine peptidase [Cytobacillus purgationiresistens]|uniref:Minor extracellular serine protease Vpr n=1 Tax=Cytobacillus purgationiresistens TaxID=863449 RepID=A0ABU0ADD3_9BACI|nr:S8 family serine peptidase [Cytobacillus purgationiresistens]MDQ0269262.1 minor extracellular serine protease Vpr [Cytobacillus purgationiresistens]